VLNEERHIGAQLEAVAGQDYKGSWEVIVADNGSTDRSVEVVRSFEGRFPSLTIVDASDRRGLNYARNAGAAAASGDFLAYCDADDVVSEGWLTALAAAAPDGDVVAGMLGGLELNDEVSRAWRPAHPVEAPEVGHDYMPYAPGGNCGVWTSVARSVRWDERFTFGGSDQEFTWRALHAGHRLVYAPQAVVHQRYRRSLRELAGQFYAYGKGGPLLFRHFRDAGMSRSGLRDALDKWRFIAFGVGNLARPPERQGEWVRVAAFQAGRLAGSLRARVIYP
jgi:glycosyltransferase involved in cell wall biosynthesis